MSKPDKIPESLIRKAQKGDRKAQKALFEIMAPYMMGVCLRYTKNREEAEDLLHDGFIRLFERLEKFSFQSSLEAWTRRVFVNMCINHITRGKSKYHHEELEEDQFIDEAETSTSSSDLLDHLSMNEILICINELPEKYSLVLNLFAIDGLSHQEIAAICGISEGASKSRLSRARVLLNERLEEILKKKQ